MSVYYPPHRSDELYHFGILGMHWGERRYQNPDGTLTEAGKVRLHKRQEQNFKDMNEGIIEGHIRESRALKRIARETFHESKELIESKKAMNNSFIDSKAKEYDIRNSEFYDIGDRYVKERAGDEGYNDEAASCLGAVMFCMSKGESPKKVYDDHWKAVDNYIESCKKAADDALGKYGDKPLKYFEDNMHYAKGILKDELRWGEQNSIYGEKFSNLKSDLTEYYSYPAEYNYGSEKEIKAWYDKNYGNKKKR